MKEEDKGRGLKSPPGVLPCKGGNKRGSRIFRKCRLYFTILIFSFFSMHSSPAFYDGEPFTAGGYLRNFAVVNHSSDDTGLEALGLWRLNLKYHQPEGIVWEAAYELGPTIRETMSSSLYAVPTAPSALSYRAYDLDEELLADRDGDSESILYQNLDRALVSMSLASADITAGRQAVSFGSAKAISPLDVIAPFSYNALAKEERTGVDAVRVRIATGPMGELDLGYIMGRHFRHDESASFIRLKSYILMADLELMALNFKENRLLGLSVARSIKKAGSWLEAAHVFAHSGSDEDYFRLSAGMDYGFTDRLYAYIEYHYNGAGRARPEDYWRLAGRTAYTEGAVYLLARHYLAPGLTYQVTPLLHFTGQALVNLNDGSVLASPILTYSAADNVNVEFGAYIGFGEEPEQGMPESEFGLYTDVYFLSVSMYF